MYRRDVTGPGFGECFRFPLATPEARRDVLVGALWLLSTLPGWILNLGHRLEVIGRLAGRSARPFPGFRPLGRTFVRGLQAFAAIAIYLSPAAALALIASRSGSVAALVAGGLLFIAGVFVLPGGMTHNAAYGSIAYLYRPDLAARRAFEGGAAYLKAWAIAASAIALSFVGLIGLGAGFLITSVWAWQVVGYAFSRALVPELTRAHTGPPRTTGVVGTKNPLA